MFSLSRKLPEGKVKRRAQRPPPPLRTRFLSPAQRSTHLECLLISELPQRSSERCNVVVTFRRKIKPRVAKKRVKELRLRERHWTVRIRRRRRSAWRPSRSTRHRLHHAASERDEVEGIPHVGDEKTTRLQHPHGLAQRESLVGDEHVRHLPHHKLMGCVLDRR